MQSIPQSAQTVGRTQVWTDNSEFSDSRGKLVSSDGGKGGGPMDPEGETKRRKISPNTFFWKQRVCVSPIVSLGTR